LERSACLTESKSIQERASCSPKYEINRVAILTLNRPEARNALSDRLTPALRGRLDDFLGIVEQHLRHRPFVIGDRPTVVDMSMIGYLFFPKKRELVQFRGKSPGSACVARSSSMAAGLACALRSAAG
jgi:glutathione S-transferase